MSALTISVLPGTNKERIGSLTKNLESGLKLFFLMQSSSIVGLLFPSLKLIEAAILKTFGPNKQYSFYSPKTSAAHTMSLDILDGYQHLWFCQWRANTARLHYDLSTGLSMMKGEKRLANRDFPFG